VESVPVEIVGLLFVGQEERGDNPRWETSEEGGDGWCSVMSQELASSNNRSSNEERFNQFSDLHIHIGKDFIFYPGQFGLVWSRGSYGSRLDDARPGGDVNCPKIVEALCGDRRALSHVGSVVVGASGAFGGS